MIYLDANATVPYSPKVQDYIKNQMVNDWANPSSEHDLGHKLMCQIKLDRQIIADELNCSTKSLIFTSGGTESTSTILSRDTLEKNNIKTIITSKLEHHATLNRVEYLAKKGFEVIFLKNDSDGIIDVDQLEQICANSSNFIVSIMHANNETGVINDIKRYAEIAHRNNGLIHSDCVQSFGKIKVDLEDLDIDFASFSGHKIGSLKGIGLLFARNPKLIEPLIHGGSQEKGLRSGTYNYAGIHSLRLAVEDIDFKKIETLREERDEFERLLVESNPQITINCKNAPRLPQTSSISLHEVSSQKLIARCGKEKIYLASGSACTSNHRDFKRFETLNFTNINVIRISFHASKELLDYPKDIILNLIYF